MIKRNLLIILLCFITISIICIKYGFGTVSAQSESFSATVTPKSAPEKTQTKTDLIQAPMRKPVQIPDYEYYEYTTNTEINVADHERRIHKLEEEVSFLRSRLELYSDILNDFIDKQKLLETRIINLEHYKKKKL